MRRVFSVTALCTMAAVIPSVTANAQGATSTQGFGFPPGQLSTRALGTGGALGELDARSPLNPAAIALDSGQVFAQYDPELRNVRGASASSRTTTARFTNFGAVLPAGRRLFFGFSASTLLDRTWSTQATREQVIGSDTVESLETLKSEGGLTDLRLAIAYTLMPRVRIGIAGHRYTGTNRVNLLQQFADSLSYSNLSQTTSLNYSGSALSAGIAVDVLPSLKLAVSGRKGGDIELSANDTLLSTAKIPDRYAASVSFEGLPGTILAARVSQDKWSSLTSLSTNGAQAVDATEINIGGESNALRTGDRVIVLRAGARWRTLPFLANGQEVKETSFGGGFGVPIANNRALIDFGVLRSSRRGVTGIKESAYNFSFGLRIHP